MTLQLELVALPAPPTRGAPLLAVRLVVESGGEVLEPVPKKRPRVRVVHGSGRTFGQAGMDPTYRRWLREALALLRGHWGDREPIALPVVVGVTAVFARPRIAVRQVTVAGAKVRYPWPWTPGRLPYLGQGGDVDNVAGAVLDALQPPPKDLQPRRKDPPGRPPLIDDRLVVEVRATSWYAAEGEPPCVEVRLWAA